MTMTVAERSKKRREHLKASGTCVNCGRRQAEQGKSRCGDCAQRNALANRRSRANPERRQERINAVKRLREQRKAAGLCPPCGRQAVAGRVLCDVCAAWHRANHAKKTEEGVRQRQTRARYLALKEMVFAAYGGACVCCGESHRSMLTIDHINGGGLKHRRELRRDGSTFFVWLKEQGFPQEEFQLLCFNCNGSKRDGKYCEHQMERMTAG